MSRKGMRRLFRRKKDAGRQSVLPLHQAWEVEHLKRLFSTYDIDCVFDVGANDGQYAQMLRDHVGFMGTILSFEPHPIAAETLSKNSNTDPHWHIFETGLSDRAGMMDFNLMADSQFSSFHAPCHDEIGIFHNKNAVERTARVDVQTLSGIYSSLKTSYAFTRPFLKMDTQGHDRQVVSGALDVLNQFIGLQSELSVRQIYGASPRYDELIRYYESLNFALCTFVPNNEGHFPYLVEMDCIMLNSAYLDLSAKSS